MTSHKNYTKNDDRESLKNPLRVWQWDLKWKQMLEKRKVNVVLKTSEDETVSDINNVNPVT